MTPAARCCAVSSSLLFQQSSGFGRRTKTTSSFAFCRSRRCAKRSPTSSDSSFRTTLLRAISDNSSSLRKNGNDGAEKTNEDDDDDEENDDAWGDEKGGGEDDTDDDQTTGALLPLAATADKLKRRTYSRRRKDAAFLASSASTTSSASNKVVQKYKKDALLKAAAEEDMRLEEILYEKEQRQQQKTAEEEEEEEAEEWKRKTESERLEEFSRLLRISEGTMNAPSRAFRFARRQFVAEAREGGEEVSRVPSSLFERMNVAQHHGPFFDQCAKASAFELMMEYYDLFDPKDDKMDGGRLANAFISRMSRQMRDGESNDDGFDLNAPTTTTSASRKNRYGIANSNAFYFEFVKQAFESSLTKNEYTVSAFLKACGKANRLSDAKKAFEDMKEKGTPKAIVYRSYIDCCASCADCEEALSTFQQFKVDVLGEDKRIRDDTDAVRAFNGVIAAAKNARNISVAKSIFKELTEDFAYLAPTEITYGAAITAAASASPIPDLEFALDLFNRSKEDPSVQGDMNKYIVSATLACLQRSLAVGSFTQTDAKAVALAKNITKPLLQRYEEESQRLRETNKMNNGRKDYSFDVSSQVFSALVSVYARANDVESALATIEQMKKLGFAVNRHILTSALTACRPRADDADGHAMATKGVALFEQSNKSVCETSSVASAAVFLYFYLGDVKKATDLYDKVKLRTNENSTLDNQILFNTMLLHCARKTKSHTSSNNAENAISIFRDMRRAKVPATERTYSLMLTVLGTHGNRFSDVEKVYKLANRDRNVRVNDFMRTAWMDANVKAHRVEEALMVYDSIIESYSVDDIGKNTSNASPSIVTFGSALFGCLTMSVERENVDVAADKAYKIFADMAKFNVVPNDWCGNLFVKVISRAGRVEDTISELKAIIKCGGSIQDDTLEGVVRALCRAGYPERALRVYKWLRSRQSDNESKTVKATINANNATTSLPKKVEYYHLTRETFQDLVQSCADNGFLADAWNLVERRKKYHTNGKMTIAEELGPLAMGSLFKAVARNAEVVEQEVDFMSKTKSMAKLAIESEISLFGPDVLCALVEAFARYGDLTSAMEFWEYYENNEIDNVPRKMKRANPYRKDTPRSKMYGALIDECCRLNEVSSALRVFDKAKDAEVGLNTVTLAFLESSCRRSKVDEWRVFDVCAQMRIQSEQRKSMKNPQAQRPLFSHHVTGDLEYESSSGNEYTADATIPAVAATTPINYSDAIESALENRSAAPKSGKKKNGSRNKYKSHEEMRFFDDEMY